MIDIDESVLRDAELLYNFHASFSKEPVRSDLILAAGSHDMRVPEHAVALFSLGFAPLILCTGGFGKITDGLFREAEAIVFSRRCRELGVPEERILIEDASTNTGENFTFSKKLLENKGISINTGLVVCKPYMSARAWATASKQWPEVVWRVNAPSIPFRSYINDDTSAEQEIQLLVGDLQRLSVYADMGFQIPVSIPDEIWDAFERLVNFGYDKYKFRKNP